MTWLVLLMLGGVALYVMKPEERLRVARVAVRYVEGAWFAYQDDLARPDAFRDALRARTRWPLVTWTLLAINLLAFVAMGGGHEDSNTLLRWGASVAPLTTGGEWWRLFTAAFIHAGAVALLVDVAGLAQPAMIVERMLGPVAFVVAWLSGTMIGTAIELSRQPLAVTVGPAGGILATYGVLFALLVRGMLRRSDLTIPLRALRRLAPAAAIFFLHALWTGTLLQPSGTVPLAVGFVFGIVLSRSAAERPARLDRSVAVAVGSFVIVAGIALPLRGIVDARPEVTRLLAIEDRTAALYAKAIEQFKLGALKAETIAQMIDRRIEPELDQTQVRMNTLGRVPIEQQALVAAADEYLTLRRESWQLRARGLHKSNMRLLRDAEQKERAALAVLERMTPAAQ